jgi:shikimate dehydrogenase
MPRAACYQRRSKSTGTFNYRENNSMTEKRYLVGLIGANIMKSLSPLLIEDAFNAAGVKGYYHLMDLELLAGQTLKSVLAAAKSAGFNGLNITRPCKEEIIPLLDELSPEAQQIGAVNTVLIGKNGRTKGYNTDRSGFRMSVEWRLGKQSVAEQSVVILGAGGAGRAVAFALFDLGARLVLIHDTDNEKAERLAGELCAHAGSGRAKFVADPVRAIAASAGVINATPIGMFGLPGLPVSTASITQAHFVADVIYTPVNTEVIQHAARKGAKTLTGDGMVLYQAIDAFKIFTGLRPDPTRMHAVLQRALAAPEALAANA